MIGLLGAAIWLVVDFNLSLNGSKADITPIYPAKRNLSQDPLVSDEAKAGTTTAVANLKLVHSLSRPLLTPTRRPFVKPPPKPVIETVPEPVEPVEPILAEPVVPVVVEEKPAPPSLELLGVSLSPDKSVAMVRAESGETLWLAVGQDYSGWRVRSISSNELNLSQSKEVAIYEIFPSTNSNDN